MMHACTEWHTPLRSASRLCLPPMFVLRRAAFGWTVCNRNGWYQYKIIDFYSSIRDFLRGPATSMFDQTSFEVKKTWRNVWLSSFSKCLNHFPVSDYQPARGTLHPTGTFFYFSPCCSISSPSSGVTLWRCDSCGCGCDCEWKNPMNVLQRQFLHRDSGWGRCFFFWLGAYNENRRKTFFRVAANVNPCAFLATKLFFTLATKLFFTQTCCQFLWLSTRKKEEILESTHQHLSAW